MTENSLGFARFLMVLGGFAPLFILWAFRGTQAIPDMYFIPACALLVILPNFILWLRIKIAKKRNDTVSLKVAEVKDQKDHILVYLFAMLIPLYDANIESIRDFSAVTMALLFILFLFWKMNLHYVNLIFSLYGYGILNLSIESTCARGKTTKTSVILITKREHIDADNTVNAYRISNTVLLEKDD
jgi:hypothetical protein